MEFAPEDSSALGMSNPDGKVELDGADALVVSVGVDFEAAG